MFSLCVCVHHLLIVASVFLNSLLAEYLKLEDITNRFDKACIMDLKLGQRVWDDFAEQDKIDRERKKYPCQEVIGFRIIGMRVSHCVCA